MIAPPGAIIGCEFWVSMSVAETYVVSLQCLPLSSDHRTAWGAPVKLPWSSEMNGVQNW